MSAITWTSGEAPRRSQGYRPVEIRGAHPVRLTRRGRAVLAVLVVMAALVSLVALTAPATATGDPGTVAVAERVTVRPGETLWAIAERVRPGVDPRATIARIRDMNGLDSGVTQAGQVLLVPAGR